MKKNYTFEYGLAMLVATALISFRSQAQHNYRSGMVVTSKGDTLLGLIDCKDWEQNPKTITFKKTATSIDQQRFSAKDASSFSVDNVGSYEGYQTQISQGRTGMLNDLPRLDDTTTVTDHVFLKLVSKGSVVNLYAYSDNIKTRYYIKAFTEKQPQELIYRRFLPDGNGGRVINKELYKSQLFQLAEQYKPSDKGKLLPVIQSTEYKLAPIVKVVDLINGNKQKTKEPLAVKFYAGLSLYTARATYQGEHELAQGAQSKFSMLPGISAGVDFYANPKFGRLVFRFDGSFNMGSFGISKAMDNNGGSVEHSFNRYSLSFSPQVIYHFYNTDQFKVNLGMGISVIYSVYGKNDFMMKYDKGGPGGKIDYAEKVDLEPFCFALPVRLGFLLNKRFDIYAQYNIPVSSISNYIYYSITVNGAQVGINYEF